MKKLAFVFILSSLIASAKEKSYRPEIGYNLYIERENVGSVTFYLPIFTYKGRPVEEMIGMIGDSENIDLKIVNTNYGKMLRIFIPEDKRKGIHLEGGGRLSFGTKSCKMRSARDDFRINPRIETGEKPVVVVEEDSERLYNNIENKWEKVILHGDTITTTSISTLVYAEFEKGTIAIQLGMNMNAPFGKFWNRWTTTWKDKFWSLFEIVMAPFLLLEDYSSPVSIESDRVEYKFEEIVLNSPGWHKIPAKEVIRISVYPVKPFKKGKKYD